MTNTVLIEQSAKKIKLAEAIVLAVLFGSIAVGLGGMYLSLALGKIAFLDEATLCYRQHDDNICGASRYSWYRLFKKLQMEREKLRKRFDRNILQAAAFGRRYAARLNPDDRKMLATLAEWPSLGFFARKKILIRYGICKSGFLRNIGMFFLF